MYASYDEGPIVPVMMRGPFVMPVMMRGPSVCQL